MRKGIKCFLLNIFVILIPNRPGLIITRLDCGVLQVIAVVTTVPEKLNNMQNILQRNVPGKYQAKVVLAVGGQLL